MTELFGSSGIRRVVDKDFLQLIFRVGLATGNSYRSVIAGHDTRTSSDDVGNAFLSGLLSTGATASCAGLVPTPTLAYATRKFDAGAMITASHNPPQYNGVKLVNPDGSAFGPDQREQIEKLVSERSSQTVKLENIADCTDYQGAIDEHLERICADFPDKLNIKVAVDCGCGAASNVTPLLLSRLGCEVIPINCRPSGKFPRELEPLPSNLEELIKTVESENADLGLAHDGDGDRIAVIDENGSFIGTDRLMALLVMQLDVKRVVTTVDSSILIDELGVEVVRTRVGDAFVSDELRRDAHSGMGDKFGGESSGCFIFPKVSLCPDAIYAAAKIVQIASGSPLSTRTAEIPSYPVLRGSVAGDKTTMEQVEQILESRLETGVSLDKTDGLRIAFGDGWLLIRASGTEPKIRLTAEAKTEQRVKEIYNFGLETVQGCLFGQ